tara:strand:+ start:56 stop:454 length:399 start_codon:yes stop_codon:yes gene_type:complete
MNGVTMLDLIKNSRHCYHCGNNKETLVRCEKWEIRACRRCRRVFHKDNHEACDARMITINSSQQTEVKENIFKILLTNIDGSKTAISWKKGCRIKMEPHWAGTYVFNQNSAILVKEKSHKIKKLIKQGMRSS